MMTKVAPPSISLRSPAVSVAELPSMTRAKSRPMTPRISITSGADPLLVTRGVFLLCYSIPRRSQRFMLPSGVDRVARCR
jgi:hypothetical protein